jgi:hypothetical protein
MNKSKVKVYAVSDMYWWAAYDAEEAFVDHTNFLAASGMDEEDIEEEVYSLEDVCEVNEIDMNRLEYMDDDGDGTHSFARQLEIMIEKGDKFPSMFACTEY